MKIGRKREKERPSSRDAEDSCDVRKELELSRTDILAVIIAMFQLVLPLIGGLIIVGAIVALILH
jgi:hypothetical protein